MANFPCPRNGGGSYPAGLQWRHWNASWLCGVDVSDTLVCKSPAQQRRRILGRYFMTDTTVPRHYVPAFKGIYAAFDPIALPLLRLTAGVILMPHGCQKLFGWFGGAGFEKFTGFFDKAG
jgi:hypothetical protein